MAAAKKISVGSIVDIRGDGTWSPMADAIINTLIDPFINVDWQRYDLCLANRDATDDSIVNDVAAALKKYGTGVKGPTITPTLEQAAQLGLKKAYDSPNGKIRRAINGVAITRNPIFINGLTEVPEGTSTLRHAVGGIYGAPNALISESGTIQLMFTDAAGVTKPLTEEIAVVPGAFSLEIESEASIRAYARYAFQYALDSGSKHVCFANKVTISKEYDGLFVRCFDEEFKGKPMNDAKSFEQQFRDGGIGFRNGKAALIDFAAELLVGEKLEPHTLFVYKNYDGDVQSDALAGKAKSLALVTSELVSEDGTILMADPPHGTAEVFNKIWEDEHILMANPTSYIFAYARALEHRGQISGNEKVKDFANALKLATVAVIEQGLDAGFVTADIALLKKGHDKQVINAHDFMAKIAERLLLELKPQPQYGWTSSPAAVP